MGRRAKESASWAAFADLKEIGLFIKSFPKEACETWSLVRRSEKDSAASAEYLLVGSTQFLQAQGFVDSRLCHPDPTEDLAKLGESLMQDAWQNAEETKGIDNLSFNQSKSPQKKRRLQKSQVFGDSRNASIPWASQVKSFDSIYR